MSRPIQIVIIAFAMTVVSVGESYAQGFSVAEDTSSTVEIPADLLAELDGELSIETSSNAQQVNYESIAETTSLHCRHGASCDACKSPGARRWFTVFDNAVVQPLQSNTTGVIVETDDGYSHVAFPWELSYSTRLQFGSEASGDLIGWRVQWWNFDQNESFVANDANGLIPIGTEATAGFLSEDGDITTGIAFITEGYFRSRIRADVIDWELQREVTPAMDFYAGLRYAKIAQDYLAHTDQGSAHSRSEFRGFGPSVALQISQPLPYNAIALFANLRGSLLFGKKDFAVSDDVNQIRQSIGEIDLRSFADGANTLASNAQLQLGVKCTPADWLALRVAFECQTFGNVGGPNPTGVFTGPDSGLAGDSPIDDSLSFAGVTAGAEITW